MARTRLIGLITLLSALLLLFALIGGAAGQEGDSPGSTEDSRDPDRVGDEAQPVAKIRARR